MEESLFSRREEEILSFWKEQKIFEKSLTKEAPKGEFVFYDGPPFATGLPHHGSLLSSVIKDVVARYKTMQGYRVPRRWGWDCHGLPIEILVEQELHIKTKKDIFSIGIKAFNEACRASVLKFTHEWERYVDRIGRWVDFKNAYKTMDNSYIESVWWALAEIYKKGLLYQGRKVLMYCMHCETPLAKAEIAMDNTYKDITEETLTVKFKVKNPKKYNLPGNTYFLAWTTTPWTLPGNVALAVGQDIDYSLIERGIEHAEQFIVATERVTSDSLPKETFTTIRKIKGKDLIGIEYEPLYTASAFDNYRKKYLVLPADFVSTGEGTGIVHTAVMYGEEDFALGKKEGLPMVQLLNANGTFNEAAPDFLRGIYIKDAEGSIKEDLLRRNLLAEKKNHTHSYPHCYRCGNPLIYNAVISWFINVQTSKRRMLAQNEHIYWVPEHLKHGRFKNIMETAPDWTISRNRFWASPLPIWKEKEGGTRLMVIGSLAELLAKTKVSGNQYLIMRHGEALSTTKSIILSDESITDYLTDKGKEEVRNSSDSLKKEVDIDLIVTSPLARAQETARIAQKVFNLPDSAVMTDERLKEIQVDPRFNGGSLDIWRDWFYSKDNGSKKSSDSGETHSDIRRRVGEFLFEAERRYVGKKILIVTHGGPALHLSEGISKQQNLSSVSLAALREREFKNAEVRKLPFIPYPHDDNYDLDLHRPYIDSMVLIDESGRRYERISEIVDCWVESGAMPFASVGYPKDTSLVNPKRFFGLAPVGYPADFIAEYVAQTRTWFYYTHVLGVILFKRRAFRAVISTGNILAAGGAKVSKSKRNYTDPLIILKRFSADAYRFYLMGSVVMQGEDLLFLDDDVREAHTRVVGILWNCCKFFELYKGSYDGNVLPEQSPHVLDKWILARLKETMQSVSDGLEAYDTVLACRSLRAFIIDYSTWYIRRSRERVRESGIDQKYSLSTQCYVLLTIARIAAPIMPFMTEDIYRISGGKEESVHLDSWPRGTGTLTKEERVLLKSMSSTRELVSVALEEREHAHIKIRQPLSLLSVHSKSFPPQVEAGPYLQLISEEVNVKKVELSEKVSESKRITLDITLTEELKEEGLVREIVRMIQGLRKERGLTILDRPTLFVETNDLGKKFFERNQGIFLSDTGLSHLTLSSGGEAQKELAFPLTLRLE